MKKLVALLLIVVLALAGYVAAGPFIAMHGIRDAMRSEDVRALERHVDFELVRSSVQAQIEDYMARAMDDPSTRSSLRALASQVTGRMAGGIANALATPAGIGAILQGRAVLQRLAGFGGEPGMPADFDPLRDAEYRYESPSRFTATVVNADGVPIVIVFTRGGLRWRVTDIRLPVDRLVDNLVG